MRISDFFRKLFGRQKEEPQAIELPEPKREEQRFILCIDGGGMRGLIPVVVLQMLEDLIRENGGKDDIARYFDLIAGTSTGGLISLSLSCESSLKHMDGQLDLDSLMETYLTMGDEIFKPKASILGLRQMVEDKYSSTNIQKLVQRWFGARPMDTAKVPTLIMAYDISNGQQQMIRSYADEADYPVWVAARATSAAPTYFSPCEYDGKLLVDGGVVANNPAIYAYFEARRLYPECKSFHILSLSTGGSYHTMTIESTRGLMNWAEQVSPMYSTAQKRTTDFVLEGLSDVEYIRIDDALSEPVKMDETNPMVLDRIKTETENNVLKHEEELRKLAISLIENMEYKNASEAGETGEPDVASLPEA